MTEIRLTRGVYDQMRSDLARPHKFAAERVGFVGARLGATAGDAQHVLLTTYSPVPDNAYIHDPRCGARINGDIIRNRMQAVLDGHEGMFHVHMHHHRGQPRLSATDQRDLPGLIASFRNVGNALPHGALLLSYDDAVGFVSLPAAPRLVATHRVVVMGYPIWMSGDGLYA